MKHQQRGQENSQFFWSQASQISAISAETCHRDAARLGRPKGSRCVLIESSTSCKIGDSFEKYLLAE